MGIYLPNMEMPKGCASCPFYDDECFGAYKCDAVQSWGSDTERASGCPLVNVPEPHGRLIDTGSGTFPTLHRNPSNDYMHGWNACLKSVHQQPTIIPASEGET